MKNMHRKAAGALLAGALLCGTAACSSDSSDADKKNDSKAAGKSTRKPVDASFAAAVERAAKKNEKITSLRYTMSGEMPESGHVETAASMNMKPLAMQMKMKVKGSSADESGEMEIRLVDDALYLNAKGKKLDGGKGWIKMPNMGAGKGPGGADNPFGTRTQAEQNPMDDSASLSASKDLEKVGEETVDGVKTTHYKGTVTVAQMRESLAKKDPATRERQEAKLKGFEKLGVDKFAMDMWIDGQDHTKQFRMRSATQKGPLDLTIKFLDYNKPVEIKAPPAGDVVDPMAEAKKDS
ncbi:DUF1396 domain-containing protein [Streptomyces mobaraensis NBRC 13819 = DSM 40847]|uniref:Lipoprotein n=1 Tax=Streptomyces mobaraensis (strain ATCC 29032 / DSM 40847 / JCM 4168 / NBRC 13819 / NCIMB 11159 / IPCR 16-22) TaxID=1223523 RepID=M3C1V7_STRM1|nr:DUF6612 family protein [Streptomyces mobaraensis]EME97985.1 lipoprotein [Streptomyces mobaraensis NBRC 13819 = DSM 40847]QTT74373.1 DUF1396 domain-containing protein [Streptomyces mobaraensis NBRC 13819 = DSM 40847]